MSFFFHLHINRNCRETDIILEESYIYKEVKKFAAISCLFYWRKRGLYREKEVVHLSSYIHSWIIEMKTNQIICNIYYSFNQFLKSLIFLSRDFNTLKLENYKIEYFDIIFD